MKILVPTVAAAMAAFATLAQASGIPAGTAISDSKTHINGPRDPFTDGAKAGRFDVYSDAAKITDRRDPFTDGAHS